MTDNKDMHIITLNDSAASAEILKGAVKRPGRPSINITAKQKQERSRQSARQCRNRKNVRYQYLEQLVRVKEKSIFRLRDELEMKQWCEDIDQGIFPEDLVQQLSISPPKTDNTSAQPTTSGLLEPLISSHIPTNTNVENVIRGDDKIEATAHIPKRTEVSDPSVNVKEKSKLYSLLTGQCSLLNGQYSSENEMATGQSYTVQPAYSTRSRPTEQLVLDSGHDTRMPHTGCKTGCLVLDSQRDTRISHTSCQPEQLGLDSQHDTRIYHTNRQTQQFVLDSQHDTRIPLTSQPQQLVLDSDHNSRIPQTNRQSHQLVLDSDHDAGIPHTKLLDSSGTSTSESMSSDTDIINWILQNENSLGGFRTHPSAQSQYNEEEVSENIPKTNFEGTSRLQWNEHNASATSTFSGSSRHRNQGNISSPLLHSLLTPVTCTSDAVPRPTSLYTTSKFDFTNQACSDIHEIKNTQIRPLDHDSQIDEVQAVFRYPQRTSTETGVFTNFAPNYCESKMLNTPINEVGQRSRSTGNTGDCDHRVQRSHSIGGNTMVFDNRVPPSSGELSTQVCDNVFPTCSNLSKTRQEQNLRNLKNDNSGNGQGQYSGCVHHRPISAKRSQRSSSVSSSSVHGRSSSCTNNVVVEDQRVQRSSSLDDTSHSDAHVVQDKFPFLSFLLKNEET